MRVADPDNAKPWCGCLKIATKIKIEIEIALVPVAETGLGVCMNSSL
jgi:hypothetical protein